MLVALGLFALLAAFVAADPVAGVTFSSAPFTDEAGNFINARNFAQLGRWSTDDWNLYLVNTPFSVLEAIVFKVFGTGIVQARLPMIVCVSLTSGALVWGLRSAVGRIAATFAGLAFAGCGLILFYGRLAFLEDLVVLGLTLGTLVVASRSRLSVRGGLLTGACYAIAIGTKPSAMFAIAGILLAVGLVWGLRDRDVRRWLAGCVAAIGAAGAFWLVFIGLPNWQAVTIDVSIWPAYQWKLTPGELIHSVKSYFAGSSSDSIFGFVLLPLIVLGSAGTVAIALFRKHLSESEARLAVAAFGWAFFGFAVLIIASYRPNRYATPLVPALAILAAIGLHAVMGRLTDLRANAEPSGGNATRVRPPRLASGALAALAVAVAVAPGLAWYGNWSRDASYQIVDIQNQLADVVPAGQPVAGTGYVGLLLMRSHTPAIPVGLANQRDLYAEGVRWYLWNPDEPAPIGVPPAGWDSAERVKCVKWRGADWCLFHLK